MQTIQDSGTFEQLIQSAGLTSPILNDLANGVIVAYDAYSNGVQPVLTGYKTVATIQAYEFAPYGNPFESDDAPSEGEGYQLMGFAATSDDLSHNILVLRGTVTYEETGYDLLGWDTKVNCVLPHGSSNEPLGKVNSDLYEFYVESGVLYHSMAYSFQNAVKALAAVNPGKPFYVAAHSLGGPLATLGVIEAVVAGNYGSSSVVPILVTFGALHLGDQTFVDAVAKLPFVCIRLANLCDFVPCIVSLYPPSETEDIQPQNGYVHVGIECTIIWQKWDNWVNHSMTRTYLPIVQNYMDLVKVGPRHYPQ